MNKSREDLEAEYNELLSYKEVFDKKCEENEQQIYYYKRQVEVVTILNADYIEEIELAKTKEVQRQELQKANIKTLEETVRKEADDQNVILLEKTEKIASLTKQIEELSKSKVTSEQDKNEDAKIAITKKLAEEIELITNELSEIEFAVKMLECQKEELEQTNLDVLNAIDNIVECLEYEVQELQDAKDCIKTSQEEMFVMKLDLESLKNKPLDLDKKGNSLFGEVEDSRLKTEQHLQRLIKRHSALKSDLSNKLKQVVELLNQNMELYNQLEAFESYDEKYEEELRTYQAQARTLESQIEEFKQAVFVEQYWTESNQPSYAVEYANNVFKSKWTEVEKLRQALNKESEKKLDTFITIKEASADLRRRGSKIHQLRLYTDILENMLLELQLQNNPLAQYTDQNFNCFAEYFEMQDRINTRKRSTKHSSISARTTVSHRHSKRSVVPYKVNNEFALKNGSRIESYVVSYEDNLGYVNEIANQTQSHLKNIGIREQVDNKINTIEKDDVIKQSTMFDQTSTSCNDQRYINENFMNCEGDRGSI